MLAAHGANPLHVLQVSLGLANFLHNLSRVSQRWTGQFFKEVDLFSLGLVIQLGHPQNDPCLQPTPAYSNFLAFHTIGIHRIHLNFCDCTRHVHIPYNIQLLKVSWWPGSMVQPKTCTTIAFLKHFHKHTLQGKVSVLDFYRATELETDNTGLIHLPVSVLFVHLLKRVSCASRTGWRALRSWCSSFDISR